MEHLLHARHRGYSESVSIATSTFGVHISAHRGSVKGSKDPHKRDEKNGGPVATG